MNSDLFLTAAQAEITLRELPCWQTSITVRPLDGGISNHNFMVTMADHTFVARINGDVPAHGVLRANDAVCNRAAAAADIAPKVYFANSTALVAAFIAGPPLASQLIPSAANLPRITALLKQTHNTAFRLLDGPVAGFWPFRVCRQYARFLAAQERQSSDDLTAWMRLNDQLEETVGQIDVVLAHNDLLSGNILDDGQRLWLIDWEHAGLGSAMFDLANLASNNGFTADQEARLLELYFGQPPGPQQWRQFRAMKCASLLREAMWARVSEIQSALPFDYRAYGDRYLAQFADAIIEIGDSIAPPR